MTDDARAEAVVLRGVSKFFGTFQALKNIDLTVREGERGVGRGRDVAVGLADNHFDARVLLLVAFEYAAHVGLLRGIVGDAELPVFVQLAAD